MPRTYPPEVKTNAESLFVFRGMDYDALATLTGVSESQLRRWAAAGAWEDKRATRAHSGIRTAVRLEEHINQVLDKADAEKRPLSGAEIDQILKLQAQAERLNPVARIVAHVIEGMDWLAAFVRERDPQLMPQLAPLMSEFGEELVRKRIG